MFKLKLKNESRTLLLGSAVGSIIKNHDFKNFEIHARAGEEFVKDVGEIGLAAGELISYIRKFLN